MKERFIALAKNWSYQQPSPINDSKDPVLEDRSADKDDPANHMQHSQSAPCELDARLPVYLSLQSKDLVKLQTCPPSFEEGELDLLFDQEASHQLFNLPDDFDYEEDTFELPEEDSPDDNNHLDTH